MKIIIKNGKLIDGKNKNGDNCDILIRDGVVVEIGKIGKDSKDSKDSKDNDAEIIDAKGKYVLPGFIDAHCHLRDPGQEYKEDIESGTRSAAMGGFTSIACMPNTNPPIDNSAIVNYIKNKAVKVGVVNVFPIGAATRGREGKELAEIGDMKFEGIVAISDDGSPVRSSDMTKKVLQYAQMFDVRVISHCEDMDLAEGGAMNEGYNSTILGLKGIPSIAEDIMVARDVLIAEYVNVPIHIAHVSTVGAVEIIRQAKKRGVKVTCETCPHYFSLTDDACLSFDTNAKVNPPLRSRADVEAIIAGLKDGTIDMIATDHAPHHRDEKNVEFGYAQNGMVGFETAFGLSITNLVMPGHLTMTQLVEKLCTNPAKMLGLNKGTIEVGSSADILVADIEMKYKVDIEKFSSKSKNSPFDGFELCGKVTHTIVGGKFVVKNMDLVV